MMIFKLKALVFILFLAGCTSLHTASQFEEFSAKANAGNIDAQLEAGRMFETGEIYDLTFIDERSKGAIAREGMDIKDPKLSYKYYALAAAQGSPVAEYKVGKFYAEGYGVSKNSDLSISWLTKSASQGYTEAQSKLGYIYYTGDGVKKNIPEALLFLQQAADKGDSESAFHLANIYYLGDDVDVNYNKSFKYMKISSESGHQIATPELAFMYLDGKGIKKDDTEFLRLINVGAKNGDRKSNYTLARLYFEGKLVDQDYSKAAELYGRTSMYPIYLDSDSMRELALLRISQQKQAQELINKNNELERLLTQDKNTCASLGFTDKTESMANCMLTQQLRRDQKITDQNRQDAEELRLEEIRQAENARILREIAAEEERQAALDAVKDKERKEAFVKGMQTIINNSYQPLPVAEPPAKSEVQKIKICDPNWVGDCR